MSMELKASTASIEGIHTEVYKVVSEAVQAKANFLVRDRKKLTEIGQIINQIAHDRGFKGSIEMELENTSPRANKITLTYQPSGEAEVVKENSFFHLKSSALKSPT